MRSSLQRRRGNWQRNDRVSTGERPPAKRRLNDSLIYSLREGGRGPVAPYELEGFLGTGAGAGGGGAYELGGAAYELGGPILNAPGGAGEGALPAGDGPGGGGGGAVRGGGPLEGGGGTAPLDGNVGGASSVG